MSSPNSIRFASLIASLFMTVSAGAEVAVTNIFDNNMVLQRDLPLPVWGTANPGEQVTVSFAGQSHSATTDANGKWMVKLDALKTSKKPQTLTIAGSNALTFNNVLVGEVWLVSGQSNMADSFNAAKGRRIPASYFAKDLSGLRFSTPRGWQTLNEKSQAQASRVGFYFGERLLEELDIPIGLIQRYNSGTPIQAWMPKESAEVIRKELGIPEGWNDVADNRNPGVQFNDKIAPIVPVCFRGAIWYQGERNAKAQTGWEYDDLLTFHIKTWRQLWATKADAAVRDFPFYYVQVPTQDPGKGAEWPWLRDAMRRALDTTINTGMAVFYDYGPSLHPEEKRFAGERLALWALAKDYGKDIVYSGPLLDTVTFKDGQAVLSFKHIGEGLRNKGGDLSLNFFELAGKDGKYLPADAVIKDDHVVVTNKAVADPTFVRYLFEKPEANPEVSLINAAGLPASPFMTDDFKPKREPITASGRPNRKRPTKRSRTQQ